MLVQIHEPALPARELRAPNLRGLGGGDQGAGRPGGPAAAPAAAPSPATHAILTVLKAGESVFQTLLLTKTVVQRGTAIVSCIMLASKHCLRRFFFPPLMQAGYGTRWETRASRAASGRAPRASPRSTSRRRKQGRSRRTGRLHLRRWVFLRGAGTPPRSPYNLTHCIESA